MTKGEEREGGREVAKVRVRLLTCRGYDAVSPAVVAQRLKLAGHIVNKGSLAAGPVQQRLYLQPAASHLLHSLMPYSVCCAVPKICVLSVEQPWLPCGMQSCVLYDLQVLSFACGGAYQRHHCLANGRAGRCRLMWQIRDDVAFAADTGW